MIAALLATLLARIPPAAAQERTPPLPVIPPPQLVWDPSWPEFRVGEYFLTGALSSLAIAGFAIPVGSGRWHATNAIDDGVRSALRLGTRSARDMADDASDLMLTLTVNHALFDAVVVAWWGHGRGSVGLQMTLIDFEAIAFTTAVTSVTKGITARERPYFRECATDPSLARLDDCEGNERYRSFFSGHTSTSFTAAGLTCMHHAHLDLYGGGALDAIACVTALGMATATGTLRIMSDNHYATDVATGAVVGLASGLGLPWLLHYRGGAKPRREASEERTASVRVIPGPLSAALVGEF